MNAFEILTKFYNYLRPFLDIALLTFVLYKAYEIILKTNALQIIKAVVIVGIAYGVVVLLNLVTMLWILNVLAPGLIVAFAIVFQPELRLLLLKIGQKEWFAFGSRSKHTYVDSVDRKSVV